MATSCMINKVSRVSRKTRQHFWRAVYVLGTLSFCLPFVSVKGCSSSEITDYHGFQLIGQDDSWPIIFPMALGVVLLALSFLRRRYGDILLGFTKAWKSIGTLVAVCVLVVWVDVHFLFDEVYWRTGRVVGVACWSVVYLGSYIAGMQLFVRVRRLPRTPLPLTSADRVWLPSRTCYRALGALAFLAPMHAFLLQEPNWEGLITLGLCWLLISLPVFLVFYFAAEGLRRGRRWAVVWNVVSSPVSCIAAAAGSFSLLDSPYSVWLLLTAPAALLFGLIFFGSARALRRHKLRDRDILDCAQETFRHSS